MWYTDCCSLQYFIHQIFLFRSITMGTTGQVILFVHTSFQGALVHIPYKLF